MDVAAELDKWHAAGYNIDLKFDGTMWVTLRCFWGVTNDPYPHWDLTINEWSVRRAFARLADAVAALDAPRFVDPFLPPARTGGYNTNRNPRTWDLPAE